MYLDELNRLINWRGFTATLSYYIQGGNCDTEQVWEKPTKLNIHVASPRERFGNKYQQLSAIFAHPDRKINDHIGILDEGHDWLSVVYIPNEWLKKRMEELQAFHKYYMFLVYPMEEETRPNDTLAKAYTILQGGEVFDKALQNITLIKDTLITFEKRHANTDERVGTLEDTQTFLNSLLTHDAFEAMMILVIKTLSEYTGSTMESIGEPLWIEWQELAAELL